MILSDVLISVMYLLPFLSRAVTEFLIEIHRSYPTGVLKLFALGLSHLNHMLGFLLCILLVVYDIIFTLMLLDAICMDMPLPQLTCFDWL